MEISKFITPSNKTKKPANVNPLSILYLPTLTLSFTQHNGPHGLIIRLKISMAKASPHREHQCNTSFCSKTTTLTASSSAHLSNTPPSSPMRSSPTSAGPPYTRSDSHKHCKMKAFSCNCRICACMWWIAHSLRPEVSRGVVAHSLCW